MKKAVIRIEGVVQGVGFRPFVHRTVSEFGLKGYIKNTSSGVELVLEGEEEALLRFVHELPEDFELLLENVLDPRPEYIRDVCDGVDDPRLRICLDVGHANAYSEVSVEDWISMLGGRIAHVHLHNNDGSRDAHAPLNAGSMDIVHILELLDKYAPDAEICIESVDALSCLKTLEETGAIEK